ncbi:hypothetical protein QJS04_geneDACA001791 [Acorus gramineus]|uniref:Uncharacterized protein n=1 Tax=Acorus gramineus TaxID=55184 RepID=A0AAV9BEM9_ACOGR|nr:hypothetical protein QJS04_geneDACA001791 [Acorus gramineus]
MDLRSMKRKGLQALCKKHNVPANVSTSQMVETLESLLKKASKGRNSARSKGGPRPAIKGFAGKGGVAKRTAKKVHFSLVDETFEFERSARSADGRRSTRASTRGRSGSDGAGELFDEKQDFKSSQTRGRSTRSGSRVRITRRSLSKGAKLGSGEVKVMGGPVVRTLRSRNIETSGTVESKSLESSAVRITRSREGLEVEAVQPSVVEKPRGSKRVKGMKVEVRSEVPVLRTLRGRVIVGDQRELEVCDDTHVGSKRKDTILMETKGMKRRKVDQTLENEVSASGVVFPVMRVTRQAKKLILEASEGANAGLAAKSGSSKRSKKFSSERGAPIVEEQKVSVQIPRRVTRSSAKGGVEVVKKGGSSKQSRKVASEIRNPIDEPLPRSSPLRRSRRNVLKKDDYSPAVLKGSEKKQKNPDFSGQNPTTSAVIQKVKKKSTQSGKVSSETHLQRSKRSSLEPENSSPFRRLGRNTPKNEISSPAVLKRSKKQQKTPDFDTQKANKKSPLFEKLVQAKKLVQKPENAGSISRAGSRKRSRNLVVQKENESSSSGHSSRRMRRDVSMAEKSSQVVLKKSSGGSTAKTRTPRGSRKLGSVEASPASATVRKKSEKSHLTIKSLQRSRQPAPEYTSSAAEVLKLVSDRSTRKTVTYKELKNLVLDGVGTPPSSGGSLKRSGRNVSKDVQGSSVQKPGNDGGFTKSPSRKRPREFISESEASAPLSVDGNLGAKSVECNGGITKGEVSLGPHAETVLPVQPIEHLSCDTDEGPYSRLQNESTVVIATGPDARNVVSANQETLAGDHVADSVGFASGDLGDLVVADDYAETQKLDSQNHKDASEDDQTAQNVSVEKITEDDGEHGNKLRNEFIEESQGTVAYSCGQETYGKTHCDSGAALGNSERGDTDENGASENKDYASPSKKDIVCGCIPLDGQHEEGIDGEQHLTSMPEETNTLSELREEAENVGEEKADLLEAVNQGVEMMEERLNEETQVIDEHEIVAESLSRNLVVDGFKEDKMTAEEEVFNTLEVQSVRPVIKDDQVEKNGNKSAENSDSGLHEESKMEEKHIDVKTLHEDLKDDINIEEGVRTSQEMLRSDSSNENLGQVSSQIFEAELGCENFGMAKENESLQMNEEFCCDDQSEAGENEKAETMNLEKDEEPELIKEKDSVKSTEEKLNQGIPDELQMNLTSTSTLKNGEESVNAKCMELHAVCGIGEDCRKLSASTSMPTPAAGQHQDPESNLKEELCAEQSLSADKHGDDNVDDQFINSEVVAATKGEDFLVIDMEQNSGLVKSLESVTMRETRRDEVSVNVEDSQTVSKALSIETVEANIEAFEASSKPDPMVQDAQRNFDRDGHEAVNLNDSDTTRFEQNPATVDCLLEDFNDKGKEDLSETFLDWLNYEDGEEVGPSDYVEGSSQNVEEVSAPDVVDRPSQKVLEDARSCPADILEEYPSLHAAIGEDNHTSNSQGLVDREEAQIDLNTSHKVAQARSIVEDDIENKRKHDEVVTEINQSSASSIQPEESTLESQAAATHVQSHSPSMPLYLAHGSVHNKKDVNL